MNSILDEKSIRILTNHNIDLKSVIYDTQVQSPSAARSRSKSNELVRQSVAKAKELFETITMSRKIPLMEIRQEVIPVVHKISRNPDIFALFEAVKAKDDYTYQHNIGVGVLATLIGRWMGLDESELSILSVAATLHDVGKLKIPNEILNKPGKLTAEEYELMKQHTVYGYEMLKETPGLNPRIALVALQHHEREDGRGYPLGIQKDEIDIFSAIVAVADVFHAMSSKRPYHDPISFHEIVRQMSQGKFGELNPHIVSVFLDNMLKKLVGKQVVLTDGRMGEVVLLNPHLLERPLVKVEDQFLDLSHCKDVHIMEIISFTG